MKTIIYSSKVVMLFLISFVLSVISFGQTTIFNEDFETTPYTVTPAGVPAWAINSTLHVSGANSYNNLVAPSDSSWIITDVMDLSGFNFVILDFQHICKIEFADAGEIYISTDNGTSWIKLTSAEYINANNSQFSTNGNKFTAVTYPLLWLPSSHTESPTNSWWMHEQFNVSTLAANQAQVRFKFKLKDGNGNGSNGNAGWFLDDIKVVASPHELIPPVITLIPPILQDTVYSAGPFAVGATVTDASGISRVDLIYRLNSTVWDTIPMADMGSNVFRAEILGQPYNTVVDYSVRAIDASLSYNVAQTAVKTFINKKPLPVVIIGTGTEVSSYVPCYGFYNYSWSGSLYTAAEINSNGVIDSIGFYVSNSVAAYAMNSQSIYLGHKGYSFYDSGQNSMPIVAQYTQIYTGNVTWTGPGWYMFKLQTPFIYNGTETLEVVWMNNDGSYTSGYPSFMATTTGQNMAKYLYSDSSMPTGSGTLTTARPNLKLVFMPNDNDYDAGIVAVTEPTGVVITGVPNDVKIKMKNYGNQTLNTMNIGWEINGVPQTIYPWSGTLLEDVVSGDVTIGSSSFTLGINTIKVWTSEPNSQPDENVLNDTLKVNVFGCDNILNGTYSVNSALPSGSGNFNTLSEAISALTNCGVDGPVVFELYDVTYNQTLVFNEIPGSSLANTVTFRPSAGKDVVITNASTTSTVRFNGTKNIIFDGSNNGTNSVNMIIQNGSTASNTAAIWLSSAGLTLGQGCENITIKNCNIRAGSNTVSSTFGVYIGGSSISTSGTGNHNNGITISNNNISKSYYGIYARSASPNMNTGLLISDNEIGSVNIAEYVIFKGVDIQGAVNPIVSGNYIHDMRTSDYGNITAIDIGQYVSGAQIVGNNISGLLSLNTGGYGAYGICVSSATGVSNVLIANNFISDIVTIKYSTTSTLYNPFGIRITGGTDIKVYYNSVNLFGAPTIGSSASMSACLVITSTVTNLDVRNNIFANSMTGLTGSKSYAVYKSSSSAFADIDYNDYYVSGAFGILGYSGSADVTTLAAWKVVTSKDVHSITVDPFFVGDTNLHTFSSNVNNKATPITVVTTDIDGEPRDIVTPDMGADEFTPLAWDIKMISIVTPESICGLTAAEPVILTVKNIGANTITTFDATYILDGGTPVTETFNISIPSDSIRELTFIQTIDLTALKTYKLFVDLGLASDMYTDNDTLTKVFTHGHNFTNSVYTMGFEPAEPYNLWSILNVNVDASRWEYPYVSASYAHSGTNSARFMNATPNVANDYLFSRCFTMKAGEVYEISYWRRAGSASYPQNLDLKVAVGVPTAATSTISLITEPSINSIVYQQKTALFTVPADDVYYFAWHATSPASGNHCYVDDINISLLPPQEAAVVSVSSASGGCGLGPEDIHIDILNDGSQIINGNLTANYQVNSGPVISENVVTAINVGDTLHYTFTNQIDYTVTTSDSLFNIVLWVDLLNDPVLYNDSIDYSVNSMYTPSNPIGEDDIVFYGNSAELVASHAPFNRWYDGPLATTHIFVGDTFHTPPLYTTTTYWVEASSAQPSFAAQVGSGTTTSSYTPIYGYYDYSWSASIYKASDMNFNGTIDTIFYQVSSSTSNFLLIDQRIYMKYVSNNEHSSNLKPDNSTFTEVYSGDITWAGPGWLAIPLDQSFNYNGVDNLMVLWENWDGDYMSGYPTYYQTSVDPQTSIYAYQDSSFPTSSGSYTSDRPNMIFAANPASCSSDRVPVTATVNLYQWEAGIIELLTTASGCADTIESVSLRIVNYGYDVISGNLTASYTVNGGSAVIENVSGSILSGDTLVYEFVTPILTGLSATNPDSTFSIVAWIELVGDVFNSNDTLSHIRDYNYTPEEPVTSDVDIPYGTSATLNASSAATITWYNDPPASPIFTGNPFITPFVYDTTYYWVQAGLMFNQTYTFDTDLEGWIASDPCNYNYNWAWNSDGGVGAAKIVNASSYTAALLTSPLYNINADSTFFSFKHRLDAESCCDEYYVVYSIDGGPWTTFSPTTGGYTSTGYVSYNPFDCGNSISSQPAYMGLHAYMTSSGYINTLGASSLQIAFVGAADVSNGYDGWYIDEIIIDAGGCQSNLVKVAVNVTGVPAIDVGPIEFITPITGFNLGNETVRVKVKNYGTDPVSNIPISYKVNGGSAVTETITATIAPGDTYIYEFASSFVFAAFGGYDFTVYTHLPTDLILVNDTLHKTVNNNALIYCASYANYTTYGDIGNVTISNVNNGIGTPILSNPLAICTYTDFSLSVPAIELAQGVNYPMSVTVISVSSYYYAYYVKAFIDYNHDGIFDPVTELVFQGVTPSSTNTLITGTVNVPLTALSGYTKMRVVAVETSSASTVQPCGTYSYGETEDYTVVIAPQLLQDGGVSAINSPAAIYSEGESADVIVTLKNFGTDPLTSIPVTYKHNANPPVSQTWTGNLAPGATVQYTMSPLIVENGSNNICAYTEVVFDTNDFNDESCGSFWGLPGVLFFEDDFEDGTVFTTTGAVWQHGKPAGVVINSAFEGDSCWVTKLSGAYPAMCTEYLVSPKMNFTGVYDAYFSLGYWMFGELNFDGGNIQYSLNNGVTWVTLGLIDDPQGYNWYDTYVGALPSWSKPTGGWKAAFISLAALDNAGPNVKFRFTFRSNATVQNEGFAVDEVKIHVPQVATDAGVVAIENPIGQSITGSPNQVIVRLKNFGSSTLTSIPVSYKISNGTPPVNATWTGTLVSGAETSYTFTSAYIGPFVNHNLCAYTSLGGDAYKFNDSLCVALTPGQATIDGSVTAILAPTTVNPAGQATQVTIQIANMGINPLLNFPVQFSVNGTVAATEIVNATLNAGASMNYTFITTYVSPGLDHQVCAKTSIANDANPTNDQFCFDLYVGIDEIEHNGITLMQNVPNPANDMTSIGFSIPVAGKVIFSVVNVLGQSLVSQTSNYAAGTHTITLNTQNLALGVYYYSIIVDETTLTRKMIVQ